LRNVFQNLVLLWVTALVPPSWAMGCRPTLAALGGGSEREPVSRDALIGEMAALYSEVLQNPSLEAVFQKRLHELASIERVSPETLFEEIEALASEPIVQRERREERNEKIKREQSRLYLGLEPYLDSIGRDDREVIERELIFRDLVNPLSVGEVEFQFLGNHRFMLGNELIGGSGSGLLKAHTYGPAESFAIGQVPVTQFLYFLAALNAKNVNSTPSYFRTGEGAVVLRLRGKEYSLRPNHPAENLNYQQARAHAQRVSKITGVNYDLPDETQWEFANRAGNEGAYHFGDELSLLPNYAWFTDNSDWRTHSVGQLSPNAFHLYDTHGNVSEWTSTRHGRGDQIIRGGGYSHQPEGMRSGYRWNIGPELVFDSLGFRLMRELSNKAHPPFDTFTLGELEIGPEATTTDVPSSSVIESQYQRLKHRWTIFRGTKE
jgi:hypothetical protein